MHTYTFNFWAIPTLVLFQKIQSQCDTDVALSADDSQIVSQQNKLSAGERRERQKDLIKV